jgi:hypothetical protein
MNEELFIESLRWIFWIALACVPFALLPAVMFVRNLKLYTVPQLRERDETSSTVANVGVSILIPARNEEAGIEHAVRAALTSEGVTVEVIVLDDHSTDRTAEIVRAMAANDNRVRLETAPPLPEGWCGKQHACFVLSSLAKYDVMMFVDADVRLELRGAAQSVAFLRRSGAGLVSGVPRQVTETISEELLIPLIHFLLLGFLPMARMRASTHPAYGAGCGQLFVTDRASYRASGGHSHALVRASLHDGVTLPRAYRTACIKTDLFDATQAAHCRMYRGFSQVWLGLAKNATEGLASPKMIVPVTVLLFVGQVLPMLLLGWVMMVGQQTARMDFIEGSDPRGWFLPAMLTALVGSLLSYLPRFIGVDRFSQSFRGALLHPLGVLMLLMIQWYALLRQLLGKPVSWRARSYSKPV